MNTVIRSDDGVFNKYDLLGALRRSDLCTNVTCY